MRELFGCVYAASLVAESYLRLHRQRLEVVWHNTQEVGGWANDERAIRVCLCGSRERQRARNKARAWLQNPIFDSIVNVWR
jgi:hypothetical protein